MLTNIKNKNLTNKWFILLLGLITAFAVVNYAQLPKEYVSFENPSVPIVFNLLLTLLFIAWIIESLLEVLQKILAIEPENDTNTKSLKIAKFTSRIGFLIGIFVALAGIHTIRVFFALDEQAESIQKCLFFAVDTILTAGVLTGGSKGIHELTNTYRDLMQAIQSQTQQNPISAENPTAANKRK